MCICYERTKRTNRLEALILLAKTWYVARF